MNKDVDLCKCAYINIPFCCKVASRCNQALGMRDGTIMDSQLSSSSTSKDYPPFTARPSSTGWCSDIDDSDVFIQVRNHSPLTCNSFITTFNGSPIFICSFAFFTVWKPANSVKAIICVHDSKTVKSLNSIFLDAENTSRILLSRSVLNVDIFLRKHTSLTN